ncbi:MAG: ABC transporter ATP-binding protein, partial [Patescibacteria group bacterium]
MTKPVIQLKSVTKDYDLGKTIAHVLKGITMDIYPGEYVMLFGASGSGKSTLMNIIAGLENVSSGKIYVRGTDLSKLNHDEVAQYHRQKIGFVFQSFNLIRSLSVVDNVALPQMAAGIPKARRLKRAMALLEEVGLTRFANYLPTELSGGQQQRVAIARALVNNPWIILADEPTGNLDSESANDIMDLIKQLNERGKRTIILITHNPDYIFFPHRVFYVKDGLLTKTVINRAKYAYAEMGPQLKTFDLDALFSKHPDMPLHERQSYELTNSFYEMFKLDALSRGRLERFAHSIQDFLEDKKTESELADVLDKPFKDNGVGLRKQLAKDIAKKTA